MNQHLCYFSCLCVRFCVRGFLLRLSFLPNYRVINIVRVFQIFLGKCFKLFFFFFFLCFTHFSYLFFSYHTCPFIFLSTTPNLRFHTSSKETIITQVPNKNDRIMVKDDMCGFKQTRGNGSTGLTRDKTKINEGRKGSGENKQVPQCVISYLYCVGRTNAKLER